MRALQVTSLDGPDGLELRDVAAPRPGSDPFVAIEVRIAGVTFPDLLMTRGQYQLRLDPPFAPGLEVAGVVADASPDCGFDPGDAVIAYTGAGGWAELVVVAPHRVARLPAELDFAQGAALVVNYHTATYSLLERARLQPGETVVVYGAAGAIGTAALQVAKAHGSRAIAVVVDDTQAAIARDLGADEVRLSGEELGRGIADVVFDTVGVAGDVATLRLLRAEGRLLVIGFVAGRLPEIAANQLLLRNLDAIGIGWGHMVDPRPDLFRREADALAQLVRNGLRPPIRAVYPLAEGATALREIQAQRTNGKVVLEP
jgi:NADPH2:quinone reductase